jgi:putative hydroxymethylpyrimidine transport system ATP-binding protein
MEPVLEILQLSKWYRTKRMELEVLRGIDIVLYEGEFVSIIGPSGSGKSTIFNIMCAIEKETSGTIRISPKAQNGGRSFGYMPQSDLLMEWKNVYDNITLPLKLSKSLSDEAEQDVMKAIEVFGLKGFEKSYPHQLSGGMRQRASLLRTFLTGSKILLLDEPFASLDAISREAMQEWLIDIWEEEKRSVLFVTHSVDEAIFLSDRIYVLSDRPASVIAEITIDLERPRKRSVLTSQQFNMYKERIMDILSV